MHLNLYELSKHINLAATFEFVAHLTCNNSIKECFYHQREDWKDSLNFFAPTSKLVPPITERVFKSKHENGSVGFSKFWLKATECQDIWSKLVDQIPPASNVAGTATKYQ